MIKPYEQLLGELLKCLEEYKSQTILRKEEIEHCFGVCECFLFQLKQEMGSYHLEREEAIFFYKNILPHFLAYRGYYSLLYHALLFCPIEIKEAERFWRRESFRLEKFFEEHDTFYLCLKGGTKDRDSEYFTLESPISISPESIKDNWFYPKGSQWLGELYSLRKYIRYIKENGYNHLDNAEI